MRPRRFHGANKVFRLGGGNEDNDLWVEVHKVEDEVLGTRDAVASVWEPTDEERAAIADGANIQLTVIGGQPPVMLDATTVPLGKPIVQRHPEPHKLVIDSPQDGIAEEWCAVRADLAETTIDAVKYALDNLHQDLSLGDGNPIKLQCSGKTWLRFKPDPDEPCDCLDVECPTCSYVERCEHDDAGAIEYWSITLETDEDLS